MHKNYGLILQTYFISTDLIVSHLRYRKVPSAEAAHSASTHPAKAKS
jgi:hypothetical protein